MGPRCITLNLSTGTMVMVNLADLETAAEVLDQINTAIADFLTESEVDGRITSGALQPGDITAGTNVTITATTDGLTINSSGGGGGGGLSAVSTDATMDGDGTAGDPLGIADGGVTQAKLANNSVHAAQLAANSVHASEIASGAVGSSEIEAGAVTEANMADNSVGHEQLTSNSVRVPTKSRRTRSAMSEMNDDSVGRRSSCATMQPNAFAPTHRPPRPARCARATTAATMPMCWSRRPAAGAVEARTIRPQPRSRLRRRASPAT